jgi:phosphoglycolate/pyridoxal phosphate phosphatase family enzyme
VHKNYMPKSLSPEIRGLILDMDGVLWKDTSPIGDLSRIFNAMRLQGVKVVLATNNATMTIDDYLRKLAGFGVTMEASQIITSAQAIAATLLKAYPEKGSIYVLGEAGVTTALSEVGFGVITDPDDDAPVVAVVAGIDRALSYDKLRRAMYHIRGGARFYGTNPDATFPTPAGLVPGAGSILAALQTASNTQPIVVGKPAPFMFELCADRMKLRMDEILVVGDRLETDISGAQAVGARTALVLSGVSLAEQADRWKPRPDLIASDLATLVGA